MQVLRRLFLLLAPYWKTLLISALLLTARAGLELVPPLFQRTIIDDVIAALDLTRLGLLIAALIGVYATASALHDIGEDPPNGVIAVGDLTRLIALYAKAPGPSGTNPTCP